MFLNIWCLDLLYGLDLVGIGFDPPVGYKVSKQIAGGDAKHMLLWVYLQGDLA